MTARRRVEMRGSGVRRLRTAAVLAGILGAWPAVARPQQVEPAAVPGTSGRVVGVGPTPAQRASSDAAIAFPFATRADEELVGASIVVAFAEGTLAEVPDVAAVDVSVNDERVATFAVEPGAERTVAVDLDRLGARNLLSVRLLDRAGAPVARRGGWSRVAAVRLRIDTTPSSLPNDLALLPLPFVDRDVDREATISVVLPGPATPERARAAALVASWLALDAPMPLSFTALVDELPEGRSLVLVDDPAQAARLGLAPPEGPSVRMADHPRHPGSNAKLLVVGGRSPEELRVAAESLASRTERLVGEQARLRPAPPGAAAPPYSAPRWLPAGRAVAFREFPLGGTPSHDGATSATLSVRFRIAPDLAIWPADFVTLDLRWTERLPPGVAPPRLDLELNGHFLGTLPAAPAPGELTRSTRLRIPRQHVRGFNELLLHVKYPGPPPDLARASGQGEVARVAISGDSVLHLEGLVHFAELPDMGLFAYDGYPFTRVPDLGETAIVLPRSPSTSELSTAVTLLAQFAQVTGRAGTRAAFAAPDADDGALDDKDLLVIGTALDEPPFGPWRPQWPLRIARGRARVQQSPRGRAWLELAAGLGYVLDLRRADAVLERGGDVAAVMGIESPASPGRCVVAVASTSGARLPPYREFLGYAESRRSAAGGDLLLLSGGQRWLLRVGPTFQRGRLAPWDEVRWFLARHWLLLVPVLLLGVAILGRAVTGAIRARMRERLALTGGRS